VNAALGELSPTFAGLYASLDRPSIPPEQLLWYLPPGVERCMLGRYNLVSQQAD
jgi:hypothetical protein